MNDIAHIQVDLIPAFVLSVLLVNSLSKLPFSQATRLFRAIIVLLIVSFVSDALSWACMGWTSPGVQYTINILLYFCTCGVTFAWFLYVCSVAYDAKNLLRDKRYLVVAALPYLAFAIVTLSVPWTHAFFFIDDVGWYHQGYAHSLHGIVGGLYVVAATAVALARLRRETYPRKRTRLVVLAMFIVPSMLGFVLELAFSGLSLLLSAMALSVLLVYVSLQRDEISLDGLTGLNNRRSCDAALAHRCGDAVGARPWCLVLIDINEFKRINDEHGHMVGDEVLRLVARALKATFGKENAFLSRYGGDEFVAMHDCACEEEARQVVEQARKALESLRGEKAWGFDVSFSSGFAFCDGTAPVETAELVEQADASMYSDKAAWKLAHEGASGAGSAGGASGDGPAGNGKARA